MIIFKLQDSYDEPLLRTVELVFEGHQKPIFGKIFVRSKTDRQEFSYWGVNRNKIDNCIDNMDVILKDCLMC